MDDRERGRPAANLMSHLDQARASMRKAAEQHARFVTELDRLADHLAQAEAFGRALGLDRDYGRPRFEPLNPEGDPHD
jgi:hypothetical protein